MLLVSIEKIIKISENYTCTLLELDQYATLHHKNLYSFEV